MYELSTSILNTIVYNIFIFDILSRIDQNLFCKLFLENSYFYIRYKLFVDAILEADQILSGLIPSDNSVKTVNIGYTAGLTPSSASYFTGLMKEMRYYRSAYYIVYALKGEKFCPLDYPVSFHDNAAS